MKIDGHAFVNALDNWLDARAAYEAGRDDKEQRSWLWQRYAETSDALAAAVSPEDQGE